MDNKLNGKFCLSTVRLAHSEYMINSTEFISSCSYIVVSRLELYIYHRNIYIYLSARPCLQHTCKIMGERVLFFKLLVDSRSDCLLQSTRVQHT